jgi:hypothetical protein
VCPGKSIQLPGCRPAPGCCMWAYLVSLCTRAGVYQVTPAPWYTMSPFSRVAHVGLIGFLLYPGPSVQLLGIPCRPAPGWRMMACGLTWFPCVPCPVYTAPGYTMSPSSQAVHGGELSFLVYPGRAGVYQVIQLQSPNSRVAYLC